jgi:hypothetical protein
MVQGNFPFRVPRQPTRHSLGKRHLEIETRLIAFDGRQTEPDACRRNVAKLKLNRTATSSDLLLQCSVLRRLVVATPRQLIAKHHEIGR